MKKRKPPKGFPIILILIVLTLAVSAAGCQNPGAKPAPEKKQRETTVELTLYFGDDQAMYLVPETRQVTKTDETLEELIIQALIDGPATKELTRTVPKETKLLSISVADGVAYANFSQELKTKHWGGSAGEMMTIYSIVNSLARLEGIEKVQFLIEGNKEESIFGHMYTGEPIEPNWNLVKRGQGSA